MPLLQISNLQRAIDDAMEFGSGLPAHPPHIVLPPRKIRNAFAAVDRTKSESMVPSRDGSSSPQHRTSLKESRIHHGKASHGVPNQVEHAEAESYRVPPPMPATLYHGAT
jgi:hypothetical protein